MSVEEIKQSIAPILERNDVSFAGVFGSSARGENQPDSDLDLLVRFDTPKGLFALAGLQRELAERLRRDVDLVTEGALHPLMKPKVMRDLKVIYGE
ncbi:hypothetical protein A3J43_00870 [Candidatus Uhrbacteria bacterium RIFCSPHIGHO2_12_FULL_54_23]|uniref:Polymerase beta nucleotidyltransferase domain-containing protein n=3 Tax=Candidatus Uhriibacteriota TaxID=1752732 RepID=A0A1F7UKX0_9BACT|nr:MAG: hypothetical protein A3J43_00870 [Candidatus Uhrbacteria bacterium RIFCSPHIGHO2_12_FULL_54_23]OGL85560.1 MAG: hypothetical protein A3B36_00695 [Candidatus Uhrbacteria bacterium RIFCSPLOWO2_01_FULL_55_36]OGL90804.1 MAG: hypothetical protein A3J36_03425 [Candidatus Uhrbacteria bacterium RIFCSPLOWO2_02_FULL_54_37]